MELTIDQFKELLEAGEKTFSGIEVEEGSLQNYNLSGCTFVKCFFALDFSKTNLKDSKFINSNLKTCNFTEADLTDSEWIGNMLCSAVFNGAKRDNMHFVGNYYHSVILEIKDLEKMI
ncbi:pentapeptide repeat-containing protein [Paenibacillus sp. FSL H8-0537]|uniref:pentapeptide repeat-containing protein n=1 Tax=Paenibacillus sp. FSL H8-0537 TaxID=2921399 RepID=UPI0031013D9E